MRKTKNIENKCNAFLLFKKYQYYDYIVETAKVPKFRWGEISELNSGHTPNEWGMAQKPKQKHTLIIAYDILWDR